MARPCRCPGCDQCLNISGYTGCQQNARKAHRHSPEEACRCAWCPEAGATKTRAPGPEGQGLHGQGQQPPCVPAMGPPLPPPPGAARACQLIFKKPIGAPVGLGLNGGNIVMAIHHDGILQRHLQGLRPEARIGLGDEVIAINDQTEASIFPSLLMLAHHVVMWFKKRQDPAVPEDSFDQRTEEASLPSARAGTLARWCALCKSEVHDNQVYWYKTSPSSNSPAPRTHWPSFERDGRNQW